MDTAAKVKHDARGPSVEIPRSRRNVAHEIKLFPRHCCACDSARLLPRRSTWAYFRFFLIQSGFPRGTVRDRSGRSGVSDATRRTRSSSPTLSSSVSYQSTCLSPEGSGAESRPPTSQRSPGIIPADAAAIEEASGSLPTQVRIKDKTPVSLKPAVTSFSSFLQTSKQSMCSLVPNGPSRRRALQKVDRRRFHCTRSSLRILIEAIITMT
jgi:hypothetical protein